MSDKKRPDKLTIPRGAVYMYAFFVGCLIALVFLWIFGLLVPSFPLRINGAAVLGFLAGALFGGVLIYSYYRRLDRRQK